jgi:molybdopterin synthase catalytic subunit
LTRIETEAAARWNVRVAIVHRLGHLEIGDISVAIAASSAHRGEAFEAGRYAIDTLKQTVPIWKKEVWAEGAEWIGQDDPAPARPTVR